MTKDLFKPRPVQTRVKHQILEKYIKSWGGIILHGIRADLVSETHFVYVDCNASTGRYDGELEDEIAGKPKTLVFGSPIIGIEALDELTAFAKKRNIRLRANAILIEKEPDVYAELLETLRMKGLDHRVNENPSDLHSLNNGEIAVYLADSTTMTDKLIDYTQYGQKFSLYLLDPYGVSGIPFNNFVADIIKRNRHDVIINFPYLDLLKRTGFVKLTVLSDDQISRLQDCDCMFAHNRWRSAASGNEEGDDERTQQLEQILVDLYLKTLQSADDELAVKSVRLLFSDKERTMFYLFLTTHDPTGALVMNRILRDAKLVEHELRWQLRDTKKTPPGQLSLFDEPLPPPPAQTTIRPTKEEIADEIYRELSGKRYQLRDVYRVFADKFYFDTEIKQALRLLRKKGGVSFTGELRNSTVITFA